MGYAYFGLQNGVGCWCGNSKPDDDPRLTSDSECNVPCTGDASISCGGFDRMGVYEVEEWSMPNAG